MNAFLIDRPVSYSYMIVANMIIIQNYNGADQRLYFKTSLHVTLYLLFLYEFETCFNITVYSPAFYSYS